VTAVDPECSDDAKEDSMSEDEVMRPGMKAGWDSVLPRRTPGVLTDAVRSALRVSPPVSVEDLPYELIDRPEPPPVPNGWYAIAASADLGLGVVKPAIAVQRELVVYRGDDGAVHTLDAHCPHMGAHLGGGSVQGDTLACPYHGWRFDGSGDCIEIPYSDARIPSRACVRSYPTVERSGMVLFWFHAGGAAPTYDVPEVQEAGDPAFTDAFVYEAELVASLQEMAENNVDYTHFHFVHRREALNDSTSQFTTDGPFSTVVERFDIEGLVFTRYTFGPGMALLRVPDVMTILTSTTPIDRRHVRLLWHFYLPQHLATSADEIMDGVTGEYGLGADEPIWRDKVFRERPLLVKGDGPITEFRRWYSQFYEGR